MTSGEGIESWRFGGLVAGLVAAPCCFGGCGGDRDCWLEEVVSGGGDVLEAGGGHCLESLDTCRCTLPGASAWAVLLLLLGAAAGTGAGALLEDGGGAVVVVAAADGVLYDACCCCCCCACISFCACMAADLLAAATRLSACCSRAVYFTC